MVYLNVLRYQVAPRFSGRAVKEQRLRRLWLRCLTAGAGNVYALGFCG